MLAAECLCNLSLGSEADCEKIAQRAGSYLHTFLPSSNESFAVSIDMQSFADVIQKTIG